MNEVERMVRVLFLTYGETVKDRIEMKEKWRYDYDENYIIMKLLCHKKLRELIMEKGYVWEQAEKIILDSEVRGIIGRAGIDSDNPKNRDKDKYVMVNEEYWVEIEFHHLRYWVVEEFMESEVRDYTSEYPFDFNDRDEERLREVYFETNEKYLSKKQLIRGLVEKDFTEKQTEEIIEKFTTKEIEKKIEDWWDKYTAENLFRRPEYKPLKHYENKGIVKRIVKGNSEDFIKTEILDCYEITQIEEWLLEEYENLLGLRRDGFYAYGTENVPFRTMRKILRDAEKHGQKSLTYSELKKRIIEECNTTQEEAEIAIYGALRTFKIRENSKPSDTGNQEQNKEAEYYWRGTTSKYPPLTLQDRVLAPLKKIFKEAEEQGREILTHEELLQKAIEAYKKYDERGNETYTKIVNREYVEMMIEDAEQLLLITAKKEDGETKYSLNHQILKATTN